MVLRRWIAALTAVAALAACTGPSSDDDRHSTDPGPPSSWIYPGADWARADAGKAGFYTGELDAVDDDLKTARSSCFVVVRNGKLVHEAYWRGAKPTTQHEVFSVTKSFTSVLVGIAVDRGELSLDDLASSYIPQWRGTDSASITVRDLLANVSGRHWTYQEDYNEMAFSKKDKTAYAIGLGQDAPPRTVWRYNNSAIQTLQAVLTSATGMEPAKYAQRHLLGPLGMTHTTWGHDDAGNSTTFSGVTSTCRDLARLGYLMMRQGRWGDQQVVSQSYVKKAVGDSSSKLNAAYGLLWWVNRGGVVQGALTALGGGADPARKGRLAPRAPDDAFWALGLGRQMISVLPSQGIVAVRMGAAPNGSTPLTPDSFSGGVLDALK